MPKGNVRRPLPKVHIIATGGTIAGTSTDIGYDAGKVSIETILQAVPELTRYAELDYEQFCNIGSQDMSESIWLLLPSVSTKSLRAENTMQS